MSNFWGRHLWDHLIIEIFALGYIELVMGLSNSKFLEHSHWGNFSEIMALELDLWAKKKNRKLNEFPPFLFILTYLCLQNTVCVFSFHL